MTIAFINIFAYWFLSSFLILQVFFFLFLFCLKISFIHSLSVNLLASNALIFPTTANIFISPSFLWNTFAAYRLLGWLSFFFLSTLKKGFISSYGLIVSNEKRSVIFFFPIGKVLGVSCFHNFLLFLLFISLTVVFLGIDFSVLVL